MRWTKRRGPVAHREWSAQSSPVMRWYDGELRGCLEGNGPDRGQPVQKACGRARLACCSSNSQDRVREGDGVGSSSAPVGPVGASTAFWTFTVSGVRKWQR